MEKPNATAIQAIVSKKEQLQKAIEELDAHKDGIQKCTKQWKDLEQHFSCIHEALKKRVDELIEKEKVFKAKALETREMLEKRDEIVLVKEQASLAHVQEKKDVSLAVIIETPLTLASSTSVFNTSSTPTFSNPGLGQISFNEQLGR